MGSINITLRNLLNNQKLVLGCEKKVGETKTFQWKSDKKYINRNKCKPPETDGWKPAAEFHETISYHEGKSKN